MTRLYLDHNASCPLRPEARAALEQAFADGCAGNPSSAHADGRRARRLLEDSRERLARVLDCHRDEIVFTSGGTEANTLALSAAPGGTLLFAPIEHPSITVTLRHREGARALPVDGAGRVVAEAITGAARPGLVTVGLANHELGVVQDIPAVVAAARRAGALVHCDASQALGKWPLSFRELGVDLLTVSAHKTGGPVGIGALLCRRGTPLRPLFRGGEQEAGLRAGTEAAALAAGFAASAAAAAAALPAATPDWRRWIDALRRVLLALEPAAHCNSPASGGLPNTLNLSFPGRSGAALVQRFDLEGVSVSHGSACASGSLLPSPVLLAVGAGEERARSALRLSAGPANSDAEVATFAERAGRVFADVMARPTA